MKPREALSKNPVISVMVSWMCNNAKDVKTAIDNTLRVFAPLRLCVKLENNNAKTQRTKVSGCISLGFSIVPPRDYTRLTQKSCKDGCAAVSQTV